MAMDPTRQIMERAQLETRVGWSAAHKALLAREKEYTRLGDEIAQQRRQLPWVQVEKEYRFDTEDGTRTLVGFSMAGHNWPCITSCLGRAT